MQMQISKGVIELYLQQISSGTVQSGSNADSSEAEQLQEATSSADTEMSSSQFFSSSRPSKEQHTPSSAQETLLQPDLDNSQYVSPLQISSTLAAADNGHSLVLLPESTHLIELQKGNYMPATYAVILSPVRTSENINKICTTQRARRLTSAPCVEGASAETTTGVITKRKNTGCDSRIEGSKRGVQIENFYERREESCAKHNAFVM